MDVDFIYDTDNRIHSIEFTGEHKAIENFLNSEFQPKRRESEALRVFVSKLEEAQGELLFSEWTVSFDRNEVNIVNNRNNSSTGAVSDDDYHLMAWEYDCSCGKLDILAVLMDWIDFIEET